MSKHIPVVGIDLDGVLCDFNTRMVSFVNAVAGTIHRPSDVTRYDYTECLGVTEEQVIQAFEEYVDGVPNFWKHIAATSSKNILSAAQISRETNLYAITKRRETCNDARSVWETTIGQSRYWLEAYNIHVAGVVRVDYSKDKLNAIKILQCEYFLDDHPDTFVSCYNEGINIYLMDAPYNRHVDAGNRRISSVEEYLEIIRSD
jgi:uncharacterized HAD superfamily protein